MKEQETVQWYETVGYKEIGIVVSGIATKGLTSIEVSNFNVIPPEVNANALIRAFNADSDNWCMKADENNDFFVMKKNGK